MRNEVKNIKTDAEKTYQILLNIQRHSGTGSPVQKFVVSNFSSGFPAALFLLII